MNMRRVKQIFPAALLHLIPPMIVQVFRTENNHITLVFIFGNLKGIGPKKPGHILNRKLRPEILYGKCGKLECVKARILGIANGPQWLSGQ
jgi:hypothetical protein